MAFPPRPQNMMAPQNPMGEFDAQSVEGAMRAEEDPMMMQDQMAGMPMFDPMMMGGESPDNPLHATDVPIPTPQDSPAFYNAGMPPAKLDPNMLMQSDYQDPRILGDLLSQGMQEDAGNSEAYQQGAMDDAEMDGKKIY